jgi:hypothetical protein
MKRSRQPAWNSWTSASAAASGATKTAFPIMCGGDSTETFAVVEPALKTLCAPGGAYHHFGPSGSGHYVKMVHNAIEYGMMESLAEGYRMLKEGPYKGLDLAAAGEVWQHHSVITSLAQRAFPRCAARKPGACRYRRLRLRIRRSPLDNRDCQGTRHSAPEYRSIFRRPPRQPARRYQLRHQDARRHARRLRRPQS